MHTTERHHCCGRRQSILMAQLLRGVTVGAVLSFAAPTEEDGSPVAAELGRRLQSAMQVRSASLCSPLLPEYLRQRLAIGVCCR